MISHKQNSRERQLHTVVFKLPDSSKELYKWRGSREARAIYTLRVLLSADTQIKEVLLVFERDLGRLVFSSVENDDGNVMSLESTTSIVCKEMSNRSLIATKPSS